MTSGLRGLRLANHYRSDSNDVVAQFYVPALRASQLYSRAVGYFTSTSLALVARGLRPFLDSGGLMRLIASPHLDADDVADLDRGYALREVLARAVTRELYPQSELELDGLGVLGRMVATGQLELKLAFVMRDDRPGVYHEKIGYFQDFDGERVAFTGSSNETLGGMLANFESDTGDVLDVDARLLDAQP